MGFSFTCFPVDLDEKAVGDRLRDKPEDLVLAIGRAKAQAALPAVREGRDGGGNGGNDVFLLAGDQVVVFEGTILEKPRDAAEAANFIRAYARSPCSTVGSVVLVDLASGTTVEGVDVATVHWDAIPESVIETLIEEGDCLFCAGGLMVEHPLLQPYLRQVDGALDSVMGLSKNLVTRLVGELRGLQEKEK